MNNPDKSKIINLKSKILNPKSKITLGFSPCPNDTFIFDAMVHGKIDTEGLLFDYVMEDVETLNKYAFKECFDVTKLSFAAYLYITKYYQLLKSGSALGYKCGPILIANKNFNISEINNYKIAVPGQYTTANFLFSLAFPNVKKKQEMLFSEIENAILEEKVNAGVIIHENRFTYEQKSLKKIIDLGEYWEKLTKMTIPLGGIAVKRSIPIEIKYKIEKIIRKSVEYALANPYSAYDFIKSNAQEINDDVIYKHIELYVNKYTINLGEEGKDAINMMIKKAFEKKIINKISRKIFI